jgi:uncharacterized protein (UPF0147 family)
MRFMLADVLFGDRRNVTFDTIEELIPEIHQYTARELDQYPEPRLFKSHAPFDRRYGRAIYIVRDPRDVAVSFYHFRKKRDIVEADYPIEEHVEEFLEGMHVYGTWAEHVGGWLGAREHRDDFYWLRYEDMHIDASQALRNATQFLGLSVSDDTIQRAVRRSSADRMRELEQETEDDDKPVILHGEDDQPFVRKAESGSWKEELPASCARDIEDAWGHLMDQFGYL